MEESEHSVESDTGRLPASITGFGFKAAQGYGIPEAPKAHPLRKEPLV